jgi:hypothetical protein
MYKMKVIFWNRGLSELAKYRYLSEMVKEEQINIISLFEIGKDEFSYKTLKNLCGVKSSFGIERLQKVVQVAYCLGLT